MAFDDLGDALTAPLSALDLTPTARSALLSFGLQAMQPTGIGQTPMGHIAQAIGAAGEAVTRNELMDQKQELAEAKLRGMDERLQLSREAQNLRERTAGANMDARDRSLDLRERLGTMANETRERNATTREKSLDQRESQFTRRQADRNSRQIGGLTEQFRAREARRAQDAYERTIAEDAKLAFKANEGIVLDKNHAYSKYKGMTVDQIRDQMKAARPYDPKMNYGSATTTSAPEDDEEDPVVSTPTSQPPVANARLAPDGNWYVPDEKRPGKFLRVLR